nr:hypothetical protein [uncultured Undibacterium sp.]
MKRDIPINEIQFSPFEKLMDIWVRFHNRADNRDSGGFRGRDSLLRSESLRDLEQLCDGDEEEAAEAVETSVNSLTAQQSWAIKKKHGIAGVWRFPQLDYMSVLIQAEVELERKLRKNIATSNFF